MNWRETMASNMTETRNMLTTQDEQMLECTRWIHATWCVRPGLNPQTGAYEERIYLDVAIHRWLADDFPTALADLRKEFSRVAGDPALRDAAIMASMTGPPPAEEEIAPPAAPLQFEVVADEEEEEGEGE
jgi:hypothetical protein